jgi:ABC-type uncharacterized transport system ATPase subunit
MVMSVDELFKAVDDLSEADLENLMCRARAARTRRNPSVLSEQETTLLLKINHALPEAIHQEFITLRDRRDADIITDTEYERLLEVSDRIEELAADRAIALVELANLRQVSLMQVMDDLGIVGAGTH